MGIENDLAAYTYSSVIRHIGANDDVYSLIEVHSWIQDLFEEPAYHSFDVPIQANTPDSFTLLEGWVFDNGDGSNILQFLYGGSIDTTGYGDDVLVLDYDGISTDFDAADLDETVVDIAADVGPLLSFKTNYPAAGGRIWVRDTNSHGPMGDGEAITTGTGADVLADGGSFTGDDVYANVYTIDDFPGTPDPQVYLKQQDPKLAVDVRIAEWSNNDSWDRGGIDVIIPVKIGGVAVDGGEIGTFVRQPGDSFTHTISTLSTTGGTRTPISTETAEDGNITDRPLNAEWYLLYDSGSNGGFSVGDVIQNQSTAELTPPSFYTEVVDVFEFSDDTTGVLMLRGLRGSITDNDALFVGTADEGTAVGEPGDTYMTYDTLTEAPDGADLDLPLEGSVTGAQRVLKGYDVAEKAIVLAVHHPHDTLDSQDYTGSGRDPLYIDFTAADILTAPGGGTSGINVEAATPSTTMISGYSDITIAHINLKVTYDQKTVAQFIPGERVTWNAGAQEAIVVADSTTGVAGIITLANVLPGDDPVDPDTIIGDMSGTVVEVDTTIDDANTQGYEFPLQSTGALYSVFIECGFIYNAGRRFSDVYAYAQYRCSDGTTVPFYTSDDAAHIAVEGQFYIRADAGYAAIKTSPFCTLAGTAITTAQSVWLQGYSSLDANNITVLDTTGTKQSPEVGMTVTLGNTRLGDVAHIFLKDAVSGKPKKDQFTCHDTNNSKGDSDLERDAVDFPFDTPLTDGAVYIKDNTLHAEYRHRYLSWTATTIDLPIESVGAATAATSGQDLYDTNALWDSTEDVQRGDIIRNTDNDTFCYVIEVVSDTHIITTVLNDGADWANLDNYSINTLVADLADTDTFFVPYLDDIEDTGTDGAPGSMTQDLTYVEDRDVVATGRMVTVGVTPIKAYFAPGKIEIGGLTLNITRTADTVFSP